MRSIRLLTLLACCTMSCATQAQNTLLSFSYDSLAAQYVPLTPTTGVFTANAVDVAGLRTVGDFYRPIAPSGNADFPSGFLSDANIANISLTMNIHTISDTTAAGYGTLTITDIDGDTFTTPYNCGDPANPDVPGIYLLAPGFYFMNPSEAPIQITSDDGFFNGYNGSWAVDGLPSQLTFGGIELIVGAPGWFSVPFSDLAVGVSGQVAPSPAGLAVLLVAMMPAARRRR